MRNQPPSEALDAFNKIDDDILNLKERLIQKKEQPRTGPIRIHPARLENCIVYISVLTSVLAAVSEDISFLGLEVVVAELESLFRDYINCIDSPDYLQKIDDAFIVELIKQLKECSFIHIRTPGKCKPALKFLQSTRREDLEMSVLDDYLNVGSELLDNVYTVLLENEIGRLHSEAGIFSPYLTIVGPSFMGKTQVAFTLSHKISVYYFNFLNLLPGNDGPTPQQPIYSLFRPITDLIARCIEMDRAHRDFKSLTNNADDLSKIGYPMKTLGFLYVLMSMKALGRYTNARNWLMDFVNLEGIMIPSLTISKFKEKIQGILTSLKSLY